MPNKLTIRLVIKDNSQKGMIQEVCEMDRIRKDGKRDLQTLEWFLDKASEAIDMGLNPVFEFLKYPES